MTDNVAEFPGVTRHSSPVSRVLAIAAGARLQSCVVIGWDEKGELYFKSSEADGGEVNWLIDQAKLELLLAGRE